MAGAAQEGHAIELPTPRCGPVSTTIDVMQDYLRGQAGYYRLLATSNMRPDQLESASYWLEEAQKAMYSAQDQVWLADLLSATGKADEARGKYLAVSPELSKHVIARLKQLDAVGEEQFKEQMNAFVLGNWRTYYTGQEVPMWQ